MENTATISFQSATERGALDSWGRTCPKCGMAVRSSLPSIARREVADHADWHARTGK
jgi:hypothetical protein